MEIKHTERASERERVRGGGERVESEEGSGEREKIYIRTENYCQQRLLLWRVG